MTFTFRMSSAQTFSNTPSPALANFLDVRDFGAVGDGTHLDHIAINKAIDSCANAGGGTVLIPAGRYLCGSIHLRSNLNLQLDAGAIILGAASDMNAYDKAEDFPDTAYQDGGHTYFHNSLIWGEHLTIGLFARHVKGLYLKDIQFQTARTDDRPALIADDVDGLDINDFQAPITEGAAPCRLRNVRRLKISAAPVLKVKKVN